MIDTIRRAIATLLVVSVASLGLPLQANAGMLGTEAALAGADREAIASFVDRAEVRARLEAYGVSPADVQARVASMTDEEAALVAARIDQLPAAGAGVVSAIVLVFLVLLLTDILGYTKIFPFTRSIK